MGSGGSLEKFEFVIHVHAPVGSFNILLRTSGLDSDEIIHRVKDRKATGSTINHGGGIMGEIPSRLA
jgi:hypothetical protein